MNGFSPVPDVVAPVNESWRKQRLEGREGAEELS